MGHPHGRRNRRDYRAPEGRGRRPHRRGRAEEPGGAGAVAGRPRRVREADQGLHGEAAGPQLHGTAGDHHQAPAACASTYDNNYFNDRWQGIPMGGYTAMVERMFGDVRDSAGPPNTASSGEQQSGHRRPHHLLRPHRRILRLQAGHARVPQPALRVGDRRVRELAGQRRWSTTPSARCRGRASSSTSTSNRSPRRSA